MSLEWMQTTWGNVATLEYGKGIRDYQNANGDFIVYGTNGVIGKHTKALCEFPSVIIGRKGAYRGIHYSSQPFFVIDTAFYLNPKIQFDTKWAYYCLLTYDINGMDSGSAIPSTSREEFYKLPLLLPPLTEQLKITSILGALDDRITLLRETNATLEAIAQALFKSWFVDFDPVHAKMQGTQPEGMDEQTAALFPDSFEESELGLVPAGWEVKWINETCDLGRGSSPRPIQQYLGGDVPWIKIADATASDGMFVFETKEKIISAGVKNSVTVQPGDLIMSNSASCGITVFVELDGCIHDGWLYFKNYKHISKNFLFFWLRKIASHLIHIADGSVQKNLNIALVSSQKVICPSAEVNQAFENLAAPLLGRICENCKQAQTLADLRDTLLPRLISGQLRVGEVEEIAA
jgi:type I restriction enzyme S subunit